jgi:hypothetical protein
LLELPGFGNPVQRLNFDLDLKPAGGAVGAHPVESVDLYFVRGEEVPVAEDRHQPAAQRTCAQTGLLCGRVPDLNEAPAEGDRGQRRLGRRAPESVDHEVGTAFSGFAEPFGEIGDRIGLGPDRPIRTQLEGTLSTALAPGCRHDPAGSEQLRCLNGDLAD